MDPRFKPSKLFFRYLKIEYSLSRRGYSTTNLEEELQNSLLTAAYGVTAWIKTNDGANWVFGVLDIEEIDVHDAYKYYFSPSSGEKRLINSGSSLRIFRKADKKYTPIPQSALDIAKRVIYTENWKVPNDEMFKLAVQSYKTWIKTEEGFDWAKSVFNPILHVYALGGLAYRCKSVNGEVYWIGESSISCEPVDSTDCFGCELSFPCVEERNGIGWLCNRCYSENFTDINSLEFCNRHECRDYGCENYISREKLEGILLESRS